MVDRIKIYYGVDRKSFADIVDCSMLSFRTLRNRKTPIVSNGNDWFMDSGAFTYLKQYGRFPYTYGEYLNIVSRFDPTYFANMDYCCESTIRNRTKHTIDTHIDLTIENGIELIDFDRDKFVMVIQGWDVKDYLNCCDKIREQGLFTSLMGIGTICGRTDPKEVFNILNSIRYTLPDWVKLHCFGLSINLLKYKEIFDRIDSIDTFAWCRGMGLRIKSKGSYDKKAVDLLKSYQLKVNKILNKNEKQSLLE